MNYVSNRCWSDQFITTAIYAIGASVIEIADEHLDRSMATDLLLTCPTRFSSAHYAVRVRRNYYLQEFEHQFTIRSSIPSGSQTELHKIMEGKGDLMLYAFAGPKNFGFSKYQILDLDVFRNHASGRLPREQKNGDGTRFYPFDVREFPSDLIVKCGTEFMTTKTPSYAFTLAEVRCSPVHPSGFN